MKIDLAEPDSEGFRFITVTDDMGTVEAVIDPSGETLSGTTFAPSPMFWSDVKRVLASVKLVFVDDLQIGDVIPSSDGYRHSVKRVSYDGADTVKVEFWKGPHATYTREYGTFDTITIER